MRKAWRIFPVFIPCLNVNINIWLSKEYCSNQCVAAFWIKDAVYLLMHLSIHAAIRLSSHHLFIVSLLAVRSTHQYLSPCFCAPVCTFSVSSTENTRNLNMCRNFLKDCKQLSQLRAVSEVLSDGFWIISESHTVYFALCFSGVFPSPGPRPSRSLQRAFQSSFTRVFFRWHQENQRGHRETECGLEQPQQEVNHPFTSLYVYTQVLLLIWASVSHCCIFD